MWLAPGRSTLDLFGPGFVLLRLGPGSPEGLVRAFADRRMPLRVWEPPPGGAVARRYGHPYVLVRPDGHVAWCGDRPPGDPGGLADLVRGPRKGGGA
ncbi:hypothetical protein [Streptomyces sp. NPDC057854]|uniref:aromatic-ring hydroxylase C-terminal domain-containing protein n=1 Tax=Streptomyces sp. NPDC057854 TaxID=3346264 RepID=UPI0036B27460